jgi:hypothetical protein
VVIDGTVALTGWTQQSDAYGIFYKSTSAYSNDTLPWQLFVDGAPLTPARWPNTLLWTTESWDRDSTWARQTSAVTACGHMIDAAYSTGADLAATNVSFNGCNAIVNNEHWVTRRYLVENHTAGTNTFDYSYNPSLGFCYKYYNDATNNRYFIDGCAAAFDAPGEWAVDADGHLMFRLPVALASANMSTLSIRGKVQSYAIAFLACDELVVSGLTFFATAILVYDSRSPTIRSCLFNYSSASRRSLGGTVAEFDGEAAYGIHASVASSGLRPEIGTYEIAVPSVWIGRRTWVGFYTSATVVDVEVRYSEGPGIICAYCGYDLFANNLVFQAAYPFGRSLQFHGTDTRYVVLRRNTLDYSGSGAIAWLWGPSNIAELNRVSHSGML